MDQADWQLDEAIPDAVRSPPPIAADDIGLGHVPSGEEARKHYVDRLASSGRICCTLWWSPCPLRKKCKRPELSLPRCRNSNDGRWICHDTENLYSTVLEKRRTWKSKRWNDKLQDKDIWATNDKRNPDTQHADEPPGQGVACACLQNAPLYLVAGHYEFGIHTRKVWRSEIRSAMRSR